MLAIHTFTPTHILTQRINQRMKTHGPNITTNQGDNIQYLPAQHTFCAGCNVGAVVFIHSLALYRCVRATAHINFITAIRCCQNTKQATIGNTHDSRLKANDILRLLTAIGPHDWLSVFFLFMMMSNQPMHFPILFGH